MPAMGKRENENEKMEDDLMKRMKRNLVVMLMCALALTCVPVSGMKTEAAHKHSWNIQVIKATCHHSGKRVKTCKCGSKITYGYTPQLSHNFVMVKSVKPTCTKNGYMVSKCKYCGDTKTSYWNSQGHKFVGIRYIGRSYWITCSQCGFKGHFNSKGVRVN